MESFAELAQNNPAQGVDSETAEWDADATDNDRVALSVDHGAYMGDERDVAHKFINMINKLEAHL